jgi:hypothetical protein
MVYCLRTFSTGPGRICTNHFIDSVMVGVRYLSASSQILLPSIQEIDGLRYLFPAATVRMASTRPSELDFLRT